MALPASRYSTPRVRDDVDIDVLFDELGKLKIETQTDKAYDLLLLIQEKMKKQGKVDFEKLQKWLDIVKPMMNALVEDTAKEIESGEPASQET